jgi:hypothetical protein
VRTAAPGRPTASSGFAGLGNQPDPTVAPASTIVRPAALMAGTASPATAYGYRAGAPYRYETPTLTRAAPPTATPSGVAERAAGAPAPTWPFSAGGVSAIVIGCVLAVIDRTLRTDGAAEKPML